MKKTAPFLILIAGILWGSMGLFVRELNRMGLSSSTIAFIRSSFTSAVVAVVILFRDRKLFRVRLRDIWIFAGGGIASILLFNVCYFKAIEIMSLSAAAILLYTAPAFVLVLSALFFNETITPVKIVAISVTIVGCALVGGIMSGNTGITMFGFICGLGSGFGYAMYSIFSRVALNRGYSSLTITFWIFFFAMLGSLFVADLGEFALSVAEAPSRILFFVLYVIVVSVTPYFLYTSGLKHVENSTASVLSAVEPVVATILGVLVFREVPTVPSGIGVLLVIGGIIIMSGAQKKKTLPK